MQLGELLSFCADNRMSDLHLSPDEPPIGRRAGRLVRLDYPPLSGAALEALLTGIMPAAARRAAGRGADCDFRLAGAGGTCRVHVYRQVRGLAASIRLIPPVIPRCDALGLPAALLAALEALHGLVLLVGPSGSGKSTTLAALLDRLNRSADCHIVTLEDPIEFLHVSARALVTQRKLDNRHPDYPAALRAALRQDPDILVFGELRDPAAIATALDAAQTGHLVLSTLHGSRARDALARLVAAFPPDAQAAARLQLSLALTAVFSQRLVRAADGVQRILAYELLLANPAIRNLIRENRLEQIATQLQGGRAAGMTTLEHCLRTLVAERRVDPGDAARYLDEMERE